MKRISIVLSIILVAFLFTGCAYISYDHPELGKARYMRIGDQQLTGLNIDAGPDIGLELEGQASDATALTEAIKVIGVLAPAAAVVP